MKKRIIVALTIAIVLISASYINYLSKPTISNVEQPKETSTTILSTETTNTTKSTKKVVKTTKTTETTKHGTYKLTHYGWDCKGCGGNTASGYNVKNTIYYNDKTYGKLRIVAMNSSMPLYSVIRIKNYDGYNIYAIVLDRGVGSGVIDLLVENESKASKLGIRKNIEIEILRTGR